LRHCRSLEDVRSWLALPFTGTVETAAAPFWRLLPDGVIAAIIRRPIDEIMDSLWRGGLQFDAVRMAKHLGAQDAKLQQFAHRRPGVLCTTFAELGTEDGCARLFEHCLPYRHDSAWWQALAPVNMQVSLPHLRDYFLAHAPQLEKLRKTAKHRILSALAAVPRLEPDDGVTFQTETFRTFYRDAEPLFAEHLVQTEQAPDDHARKNLPLLERLDDLGGLQVLTARSNGRMFGYLMSVVAPALDSPDELHAEHTIFFASPLVRNLGMRLQRAALDALRERGVTHVIMRAGHRGSGPRLGTFYRRLGAEPFGELYRLELETS
jgi:GNAT superfamily N-acetyltransferase